GGLESLNTDLPTGSLFPDGSSAFLTTSHDANVAEFERHAAGDGKVWDRVVAEFMPNADLAFGVLSTDLWARDGLQLAFRGYRRLGRNGLHELSGRLLQSCRDWVRDTFASERIHGLLAPWVLHTGLGPDAALSGYMTQVIAIAVELGGMPVPRGGGVQLVEALTGIVRDGGGDLETDRDVEQILVRDGRAVGVRVAGGDIAQAGEAVVANVTPNQLYGRLLSEASLPPEAVEAASRYRFGRAGGPIPMARSGLPRWQGA